MEEALTFRATRCAASCTRFVLPLWKSFLSMFPTLSDLINYLFNSHINLPFQTYGFMLAIAFFTGGWVLYGELNRKEQEGMLLARVQRVADTGIGFWTTVLFQGILLVVMVWKLTWILCNYPRFLSNPPEHLFSLEGSIPALLAAAALFLAVRLMRHLRNRAARGVKEVLVHPAQHTWRIMIVAILSAIAGSKLFDIFDNLEGFLNNPVGSLFSFNGFAFLGGFVVTVVVLILYVGWIKLDWKQVIDCSVPAILIGYAIGRLGCHLSGDGCWGIVNTMQKPIWLSWLPDWLWASNYAHNVISQGIQIPGCSGNHCRALAEPVFPTSLYESMGTFLIFLLLWSLRKRIKRPVMLFALFLVLFGSERFTIELIRVNNRYDFLGIHFTQAEAISLLMILSGLLLLLFYPKRWYKMEPQASMESTPSDKS